MRSISTVTALVLTLALAAPALAGGWAVTTLDTLPPEFRAQETYSIGYTIRQHGTTPVNVDKMENGYPSGPTEILITSPDGAKTLRYKGVQTGATGHYVAKVIFPYYGTWKWQVTQGVFEAQSLGEVKVLPFAAAAQDAKAEAAKADAAVGASAPAQTPAGPNGILVTVLLLAAAGAALVFGTRMATLTRRTA